MIIIPTIDAEDGTQRAQRLLREAAAQRRKVTLVVFGDSNRAREIASRADVRADDHPLRQVLWMPDPRVIGDADDLTVLRDLAEKGTEAAFFTLEFELASSIGGEDALRFSKLERGFANALAGA